MLNGISARSLLSISHIHELTIRLIDFVIAFTQYDPDMYVFMDLTLGMGVDGNRGEWDLNLEKLLYGLKQVSEIGLII